MLNMQCPKCKKPLRFTVYLHVEAGLDSYGHLGKRAFRKVSVFVSAALWETAHFFCSKCGYSIDPIKRVRLVDDTPTPVAKIAKIAARSKDVKAQFNSHLTRVTKKKAKKTNG
jgi:hypothetical protein